MRQASGRSSPDRDRETQANSEDIAEVNWWLHMQPKRPTAWEMIRGREVDGCFGRARGWMAKSGVVSQKPVNRGRVTTARSVVRERPRRASKRRRHRRSLSTKPYTEPSAANLHVETWVHT